MVRARYPIRGMLGITARRFARDVQEAVFEDFDCMRSPRNFLSETFLWCGTWPQSQDQQRSFESPEERPHVHVLLSFWMEIMRVTVRAVSCRASHLASVVECHDS